MLPISIRRTGVQPRLFQLLCRQASSLPQSQRAANKGRPRRPKTEIVDYPPRRAGTAPLRRQREQPILEQRKDEGGVPGVTWWEQDAETGERTRLSEAPEEAERRYMREKIRELDADLAKYEKDNGDAPNEALLEALTPTERARVLQLHREQKEREARVTEGLKVLMKDVDEKSMPVLNAFNRNLRSAALEPHVLDHRPKMWKAYTSCKRYLPRDFLDHISRKAWKVMFNLLPVDESSRAKMIIALTNDLKRTTQQPLRSWQISRVEALVHLGNRVEAYNELSQMEKSPQAHSAETLELIVRMSAEMGDIDRGLATLRQLYAHYPEGNARLAIPLASAALRSGQAQLAFALYLMMRAHLGPEMNMQDYDEMSLSFLSNGKKSLALAVFRDMMLQSVPVEDRGMSHAESRERYKQEYEAILGRVNSMQRLSTHLDELNSISLTSLTALPRAWQNKYFFASWLKKLIGMQQVDAAAQVIELMYERGVRPDPTHVNGLLGALLRRGRAEDVKLAEQMGWTMIQQRLEFAWKRREEARDKRRLLQLSGDTTAVSPSSPGPPDVQQIAEGPPKITLWKHREVPAATLETFCVLALHLLLKERYDELWHLHNMLRVSEIRPDIYFINQQLKATLYCWADARKVWQRFLKWTQASADQNKPAPDIATFEVLWETQLRRLFKTQRHRLQHNASGDSLQDGAGGFPTPRHLFARMASWARTPMAATRSSSSPPAETLTHGQQTADANAFTDDLYIQILQCFCFEKDFAGAAVAMRSLHQLFPGVKPSGKAEEMLCLGVANTPMATAGTLVRGRQRPGRKVVARSKAGVENVRRVLALLRERRAAVAGGGQDMSKLALLTEFLRVILVRMSGSEEEVEKMIARAAEEMDVEEEGVDVGMERNQNSERDAAQSVGSDGYDGGEPGP